MERKRSRGFAELIGALRMAGPVGGTTDGSTKASEAIAGRSVWQHDMLQELIPAMSWPQSMWFSEEAGEFWPW
jgi:hypothetical protein